jgi:hypothetical protein
VSSIGAMLAIAGALILVMRFLLGVGAATLEHDMAVHMTVQLQRVRWPLACIGSSST